MMLQTTRLIGLCDEIAALARLNLPLETTLPLRSRLLSRKLARQVRLLAGKLETGQSLAEALKADPSFPPAYLAIIEAGLASGRLAEPLEELARSTRLLRDNRRFLVRATLYPMLVVSLFWMLFGFLAVRICAAFHLMFQDTGASWPLMRLLAMAEARPDIFNIGLAVGLAVLWIVYAGWCFHASRSTLLSLRAPLGLFGVGKANREMALAAFARLCALMLRADLPLSRAMALALKAVGDRNVKPDTETELERWLHRSGTGAPGELPAVLRRSPTATLLRWMLKIGDRSLLLSGLDQFAEINEHRARRRLERMELWLPIGLTFFLGALTLAAYLGTVVFPYIYLLYHVASTTV